MNVKVKYSDDREADQNKMTEIDVFIDQNMKKEFL